MEEYPKTVKLKNNAVVTLNIMKDEDLNDVVEFFQLIDDEDRLYLRMDTRNPENVKKRFGNLNYDRIFPIVARVDDKIIGLGTLYRSEFGWKRDLGELRVVITKSFQRKGLATILTREIFFQALKKKLYKIQAEMMDSQLSAIAAFEKLGFRKEATLNKHVTDISGVRRNLVIMTLDVQDLWYLVEDYIKTPDFRIH